MEIDELISLVTKQVKERLEAFERRKKVLMLGSFRGACLENLCSMLESSGFRLCDTEMYKKEQDLDDYEFIVVTKAEFREMLQQAGHKADTARQCAAAGETSKSRRLEKKIMTEQDILTLVRDGCGEIIIGRKTIITPLALDSAKVGRIRIVRE
ncbi:MAG TPA: hypothetical protein VEG39_12060 [Clostridia bacterium]|nr:hypothetical protein [Clostridia bacterium]